MQQIYISGHNLVWLLWTCCSMDEGPTMKTFCAKTIILLFSARLLYPFNLAFLCSWSQTAGTVKVYTGTTLHYSPSHWRWYCLRNWSHPPSTVSILFTLNVSLFHTCVCLAFTGDGFFLFAVRCYVCFLSNRSIWNTLQCKALCVSTYTWGTHTHIYTTYAMANTTEFDSIKVSFAQSIGI